jgi:CelD/BcsL family acetyltransferase involved in cellulose biosynthesis
MVASTVSVIGPLSRRAVTRFQTCSVRDVTAEELWAQRDRWDQISPSLFSGPDWHRVWLQHFGHNVSWKPAAAYSGHRLVAVAPWMEYREEHMGIPLRVLSLAANMYSPISTLALDGPFGMEAPCTAIMDAALSRPWDLIRLQHIPEESGAAAFLCDYFRQRDIPHRQYESAANWYMRVTCTADEYLAGLERYPPRYVRRRERKLAQAGRVSILLSTGGPDLDHHMDQYYRVYRASWKIRETDPTFHRDLARVAAKRGWLRLGLCLLDDRPIAAQLWLVRNGVAYIVKLSYDEAYGRYSPGVILTAFLMRSVIDQDRVREVDYLKGDEEYKRDWTPLRRTRQGFIAYNRATLRGRMAAFLSTRLPSSWRTGGFWRSRKSSGTPRDRRATG